MGHSVSCRTGSGTRGTSLNTHLTTCTSRLSSEIDFRRRYSRTLFALLLGLGRHGLGPCATNRTETNADDKCRDTYRNGDITHLVLIARGTVIRLVGKVTRNTRRITRYGSILTHEIDLGRCITEWIFVGIYSQWLTPTIEFVEKLSESIDCFLIVCSLHRSIRGSCTQWTIVIVARVFVGCDIGPSTPPIQHRKRIVWIVCLQIQVTTHGPIPRLCYRGEKHHQKY